MKLAVTHANTFVQEGDSNVGVEAILTDLALLLVAQRRVGFQLASSASNSRTRHHDRHQSDSCRVVALPIIGHALCG
ncbi:hypothetical protein [Crateriforma conspicua]|uniref:hypothetical protein n=1 Tax=Crateriforma TaxID=2714592 RepID=UPI0018CCF54B|nr:hypothetical protein [Crateriforma conspicua]